MVKSDSDKHPHDTHVLQHQNQISWQIQICYQSENHLWNFIAAIQNEWVYNSLIRLEPQSYNQNIIVI